MKCQTANHFQLTRLDVHFEMNCSTNNGSQSFSLSPSTNQVITWSVKKKKKKIIHKCVCAGAHARYTHRHRMSIRNNIRNNGEFSNNERTNENAIEMSNPRYGQPCAIHSISFHFDSMLFLGAKKNNKQINQNEWIKCKRQGGNDKKLQSSNSYA